MSRSNRSNKLKNFRIHYFVGDYFAEGEVEKTTVITARSESEAEDRFYDLFDSTCHMGWIDEL